ncbi:MAG: subtilase-type protease inhibitor [Kutzneria sp.]|nr:subtilase-type protease inhibitor [Kutzneria sp.]
MKPSLTIAGVLAAGCATLGVTSTPAVASVPGPPVPSVLTLTADSKGTVRTVELTCFPTGGTHPKAGAACGELIGSNGDFDHLIVADPHYVCPMIYMPVKVSATGQWRGQPVMFHATYGNPCERDNLSGVLFQF